MDYSRYAIYSDLDGTLFDDRRQVPPQNLRAIQAFTAGGGLFAPCTGREPGNALPLLGEVVINAPAVVLNGGGLFDFAARRYLRRQYLKCPALPAFLQWCLDEMPQIDIQLYTDEGIFYITPEQTADPAFRALHEPCRFADYRALRGHPLFEVMLRADDHPTLLSALARLGLLGGAAQIDAVLCGDWYYELLPHGINKGAALDSVRALPQMAGRTLIAIGDHNNDLELMDRADISVAPANALAAVRAKAHHTVCSNEQGAIAAIIEQLLPLLARQAAQA